MPDNFYALLDDASIRRISLLQQIEASIRRIFLQYGQGLLEGRNEEIFDGNYKIEEDEILYVSLKLPDFFEDVNKNPTGIQILDLVKDNIKSLFWYEENVYYFQNFDSRKLLRHKNVLFYNSQTFDTLKENAFIIDNQVNAIFKENKFLFLSYPNANKIFSLAEFYAEATDEEVEEFGKHKTIAVEDKAWFKEHLNTVIRKQITLIQKSKVLDGANTTKIKSRAKKFKLSINLDNDGKIIFPCDKKACREILLFLNEQYYIGLITGNHYKTSSKKTV